MSNQLLVNDTKQERKTKFLEGFLLGTKWQHVTSGSEPIYREAKEVLVEVPKAAAATENVGPVDVVNEPKPVKKMRFLERFLSGSKLYKAATSGEAVHLEVKETIEKVRPVGESVHREVKEATTATEPVAAAVEPLSIVSTGSGDEPQHETTHCHR
jgi:hypothetical protein